MNEEIECVIVDNESAEVESTFDDEPPKRRRGRPSKKLESLNEEKVGTESAKAKTGPKKRKFGVDSVDVLAKQLAGVHLMAAVVTGEPLLALSESEATMLASSLVGIAEEYGVMISGKTAATLQFIGVAGMLYVPRLVGIQSKRAHGASTVENVSTDNQPG